jgi:heat shock protein HslJ
LFEWYSHYGAVRRKLAMNKKPALVFLLLISFVLTACRPESAVPTIVPKADSPAPAGSQQETGPAVLPTAIVAEIEPAEESEIESLGPATSGTSGDNSSSTDSVEDSNSPPAEEAVESTEASQEDFIGTEWIWLSYQDPDQDDIVVSEPGRYSLEFNVDDTFVYKADCNQGSGVYQLSGDRITLELGPVILAVCPEGSQADQFIQLLRDVTSFVHQVPLLALKLDSGSGELLLLQSGFSITESAESGIVGIEWHWSGFSDPAQGPLVIDDPENYKMVLLPEGQIVVQADCNQGTGTYLLGESGISISLDSVTNETCAAGSKWEQYIRYLNIAAIHFIQDDDLYIDLIYDSGTMRFVNGDPLTG